MFEQASEETSFGMNTTSLIARRCRHLFTCSVDGRIFEGNSQGQIIRLFNFSAVVSASKILKVCNVWNCCWNRIGSAWYSRVRPWPLRPLLPVLLSGLPFDSGWLPCPNTLSYVGANSIDLGHQYAGSGANLSVAFGVPVRSNG